MTQTFMIETKVQELGSQSVHMYFFCESKMVIKILQ